MQNPFMVRLVIRFQQDSLYSNLRGCGVYERESACSLTFWRKGVLRSMRKVRSWQTDNETYWQREERCAWQHKVVQAVPAKQIMSHLRLVIRFAKKDYWKCNQQCLGASMIYVPEHCKVRGSTTSCSLCTFVRLSLLMSSQRSRHNETGSYFLFQFVLSFTYCSNEVSSFVQTLVPSEPPVI